MMSTRSRVAGAVVLMHGALLLAAFFVLAAVFEFPMVLREPPQRILELFMANQGLIRPTYYLFTLTGVTFIAMALAMHEALSEIDSGGSWNRVGLVAGILAGITQAFGFIRWVWFVPSMAAIATDPSAAEARREAALVMFEGMHQFAGVSVGENLSFLFQGLWTVAISLSLITGRKLERRLGLVGVVSGVSFVVYTLEQFGGPFAWLGELNVAFHSVWLAWLGVLAWALLRGRVEAMSTVGTRPVIVAIAGALLLLATTMVGV